MQARCRGVSRENARASSSLSETASPARAAGSGTRGPSGRAAPIGSTRTWPGGPAPLRRTLITPVPSLRIASAIPCRAIAPIHVCTWLLDGSYLGQDSRM